MGLEKKTICSLFVLLFLTSSIPIFYVFSDSQEIVYMKISLYSVQIHNNHEDILNNGDGGEIYFEFSVNGSNFGTAQYKEIYDGNTITLDFDLFDSLIKDYSALFVFIKCIEADTLTPDDFVGECNFTLLPLNVEVFVATYGNYERFSITNSDATFNIDVNINNNINIPPKEKEAHLKIILKEAVILDDHEVFPKNIDDSEIYFSYEIYGAKKRTEKYTNVETDENIQINKELYKGFVFGDEFEFKLLCYESDIDKDDLLGGIYYLFPFFSAEWFSSTYGVSSPWIISISDVIFNLEIMVTYPAIPSNYDIITLGDAIRISFSTSMPAESAIYYRTSSDSSFSSSSDSVQKTDHVIDLLNLLPNTLYYFMVETNNYDDEKYIDDNSGIYYSFITNSNLPILTTLTKDLGINKEFRKALTYKIGDVIISLGIYAGISAPLLFTLQTPKYNSPGDEITTTASVIPLKGFAGAGIFGEVSLYGYSIPLIEPESKFGNFTSQYGDILIPIPLSYKFGKRFETEDDYAFDLTASVEVLFEVGISLEANISMSFSGSVVNKNTVSYILNENHKSISLADQITTTASNGDEISSDVNITTQFNSLFFRVKSLNLSITGSLDTPIIANPSVNLNIPIIGAEGPFNPINFDIFNEPIFPVILKYDSLQNIAIIDTENPFISDIGVQSLGINRFKFKIPVLDNGIPWKVIADIEYSTGQQVRKELIREDIGTFLLELIIPNGESVIINFTVVDGVGRTFSKTFPYVNPSTRKTSLHLLSIMLSLISVTVLASSTVKRRYQGGSISTDELNQR